MLFSRKAVTDSLLSKLGGNRHPEDMRGGNRHLAQGSGASLPNRGGEGACPSDGGTDLRDTVPADQLYKRLSILSH